MLDSYSTFTMLPQGYWGVRILVCDWQDRADMPEGTDPEGDYEPLEPGTPVTVTKADTSKVEAFVDRLQEVAWGFDGLYAIYSIQKRRGRLLRAAPKQQSGLPDLWGSSR